LKNFELQLDLAVIDEKIKADVLFWKPKRKKRIQTRVDKTSS
jgi:hypothetical protein